MPPKKKPVETTTDSTAQDGEVIGMVHDDPIITKMVTDPDGNEVELTAIDILSDGPLVINLEPSEFDSPNLSLEGLTETMRTGGPAAVAGYARDQAAQDVLAKIGYTSPSEDDSFASTGGFGEDEVRDTAPVMLFSNLVFRDGLNVTVRRGSKWSDARGPVIGQALDEDGNPDELSYRGINVIDTLFIPFHKLGEDREYNCLLQFEHDPACHNVYTLLQVMRNSYPAATPTSKGGFDMNDHVTVVFFTVKE